MLERKPGQFNRASISPVNFERTAQGTAITFVNCDFAKIRVDAFNPGLLARDADDDTFAGRGKTA